MCPQENEIRATGRRKTAVATVRLASGDGKFEVNGKPFAEYFRLETLRNIVQQPLKLTTNINKYDIRAKVTGGGLVGQAGALRHGLSRALSLIGDEVRQKLKQEGMLTRDHRMKERKKYGQPGARKRFQFSKR
jgi:small subunit ribosomal protein S9